MRNAYKLPLLLLLLTIYACGGDDTPPVIPVVDFTHERQIVEVGDEVTFVSTDTDADTFLWEFGDGETSVEQNPVHTYTTTGEFTVTVTVTSSTGDTASSTSMVTVGTRWVAGFSVNSFPATDQNGDPWDADSGPELLFGYAPAGEGINVFELGSDITANDLPLGGTLDVAAQVEFTDAQWNFVFIDNDEPLDQFTAEATQLMAAIEINPALFPADERNFTTGQGVYTVSTEGYSFTILYQIRN